jgi:hypothetical protein
MMTEFNAYLSADRYRMLLLLRPTGPVAHIASYLKSTRSSVYGGKTAEE